MNPWVWLALGAVAAFHVTAGASLWGLRRSKPTRHGEPSDRISILKPLKGARPGLRENLASFFEQEGARYELLFGIEEPDDAAGPIVLELMRQHPTVPATLVVTQGQRGLNPKVRNLCGLAARARHGWLLVSDDNVKVGPHHLIDLLTASRGSGRKPVGMVTSAIRVVEQRGFGGWIDAVRMNGFVAGTTHLAARLGQPLVVGKTMLVARAALDAEGGFSRLADVLAEDYVAGRMLHHAGYRVVVSDQLVDNVAGHLSIASALSRQLRWAVLRSRLHPAASIFEVLLSPLSWILPLAMMADCGLAGAVGICLSILWMRDGLGWLALRGLRGLVRALLVSPVAELIAIFCVAISPLKRHVGWRGGRLRVGPGTLLYRVVRSRW